ncbi:MAG: hypothetical protein A2534_03025 [Candidatus Magasanikbacteria bacterium RIFOXYD2_FULL_39_9]|uniref:Guanylate kinase n=1 Tax=Candidatus Magasanikbacteria bacterium RIFOXYD1_FULL_40_23 TaxID=1798705 RepID=A0A1F6P852_9BACT|nr:MAG: hypothetical protein A2534_03025 [Candidatus Magasanikbacteria bacterium RIFOXYD2_FULL_39_9]OGH92288.1 MAG: hypothetical protein A2563_04865 [Candidatus Magasanikbacteria bacterium RIFOXYD1_FULL_40_23]
MQSTTGLFVIISSPTGGGKDATIEELIKIFPNSARLVTTTSRAPRPADQEGVTYNFISKEDFESKIKEGYFVEYNNYASNYYGTPKEYLAKMLAEHSIVFSNIDVNGKHSMDKLGIKNLSIFLLPESIAILEQRVEKRGGLTKEQIAERIKIVSQEIEASKDYGYKLTNYEGKLDETVANVAKIVQEHLKSNN